MIVKKNLSFLLPFHLLFLYKKFILDCLKVSKEIVLEAARDLFLPNYVKSMQDKQVDIKDGNTGNLVTQTDRNIQKFIRERLMESFPNYKFMGEEEDELDHCDGNCASSCACDRECIIQSNNSNNVAEDDLGNDPTWILDPIDGTTNFVHQFTFTVISLALCVNSSPVIGIIYCPVTGELFEAVSGNGAKLNGVPLKINADGLDLIHSLVITEFGATGNGSEESVKNRINQLTKLVRHGVHGIRMLGSAAFNLTRLTTNSAQIYFEQGIHAWDIAAGVLIIKEAGGVVSELPPLKCTQLRINGR